MFDQPNESIELDFVKLIPFQFNMPVSNRKGKEIRIFMMHRFYIKIDSKAKEFQCRREIKLTIIQNLFISSKCKSKDAQESPHF